MKNYAMMSFNNSLAFSSQVFLARLNQEYTFTGCASWEVPDKVQRSWESQGRSNCMILLGQHLREVSLMLCGCLRVHWNGWIANTVIQYLMVKSSHYLLWARNINKRNEYSLLLLVSHRSPYVLSTGLSETRYNIRQSQVQSSAIALLGLLLLVSKIQQHDVNIHSCCKSLAWIYSIDTKN